MTKEDISVYLGGIIIIAGILLKAFVNIDNQTFGSILSVGLIVGGYGYKAGVTKDRLEREELRREIKGIRSEFKSIRGYVDDGK